MIAGGLALIICLVEGLFWMLCTRLAH